MGRAEQSAAIYNDLKIMWKVVELRLQSLRGHRSKRQLKKLPRVLACVCNRVGVLLLPKKILGLNLKKTCQLLRNFVPQTRPKVSTPPNTSNVRKRF